MSLLERLDKRFGRYVSVRRVVARIVKTTCMPLMRLRVRFFPRKAVLFVGHAYYNTWYLSRGLRAIDWKADVLNWDPNKGNQIYYHGEDFIFDYTTPDFVYAHIAFFLKAWWQYDIFHFSNAHAMCFGFDASNLMRERYDEHAELEFLRSSGKKIVYSNNGCLDGVSQTSFSRWGDAPVCNTCRWKDVPDVCSDARNLTWGRIRNYFAHYQCLLGGNRVDFNDDPTVHEEPEFYCLDPEIWDPGLEIPPEYRLRFSPGTVRLYHTVGNAEARTLSDGVNIKSTHIYLPLIERLKQEGMSVELMRFSGVPNKVLRFYQLQADIVLDMLTYGFFGANVREAMMLGKPAICYLRPEWLESMRAEIPEYVDELPVISATPDTVYEVLCDLIAQPDKRRDIGARSREFALKWHSKDAAACRFDRVYGALLGLQDPAQRGRGYVKS